MDEKLYSLTDIPRFIKEESSGIFDENTTWELMLLFHDLLLIKLMEVAKRNHPEWSYRELHKCARHSLLNCLSSEPGNFREGALLFYALRDWLVMDDMHAAQNIARELLNGMLVDSFNKHIIEQMAPLAKIAERVADGPKQKALNYKERDKLIVKYFESMVSPENEKNQTVADRIYSARISKSTAQRRVMTKYDISLRQLQRILKNKKNVI